MKNKSILVLMILLCCTAVNFSQTDITIKKKISFKIPGMENFQKESDARLEEFKKKNPDKAVENMDGMQNRKSTVYIKGARMRTDIFAKIPSKLTGKPQPVTYSTIYQCDKRRLVQFNDKKKKYYLASLSGETSENTKNSTKGGFVTISGSVTDTGERAKVFGFDAKHLKQTITITPGKNACMKEKLTMEIEGWYAELPEFSCPLKQNTQEMQMGENCFDEVVDEMKGAVTGIALKEVKKITVQGMTVTIEEEATEVLKNPLADSLFEAPTNYSAANTLKEVQENAADEMSAANQTTNQNAVPSSGSNGSPTFAPPTAGLEKPPLTDKKTGMIRIGVAKPKVTTPDTKKDPSAGADIASATQNSLIEFLKSANVEAVALETEFPENECKEKQCDYIFYADVSQKRGGGGMFKSMIMQGAMMAGAMMVPGIGAMIASSVASQIMGQTMGKNAKAKDEFSFDYKVFGIDKTILAQAATKKKTEKDGEDVLTAQIQEAAKNILSKLQK